CGLEREQFCVCGGDADVFRELRVGRRHVGLHANRQPVAVGRDRAGVRGKPEREQRVLRAHPRDGAEQLETESVRWRWNRALTGGVSRGRGAAVDYGAEAAVSKRSAIGQKTNLRSEDLSYRTAKHMIRSKVSMGIFWAILALALHLWPGVIGP